jgi:phage tail sheath protein FI
MTVTPTYPGVYITEIPSGSRTITGVATSITAFVGSALRGPLDDPVPISNFSEFERLFGGLSRSNGLGYAVRDFYLNGGGAALVVRVARVAEDATTPAATASFDVNGLTLDATGPGSWANTLTVVVTHPTGQDAEDVAAGQGVEAGDLFGLDINDGTTPVESYQNMTVAEGPRRADLVLGSSLLLRVAGALPDAPPADGEYVVTTLGADGDPPEAEDYNGTGFAADKRGLHALLKADLFNLLCLPPPTPEGDLPASLWADAAQFCFDSKAFLIVDPPATITAADVLPWPASTAGLSGTTMRNAALYFPRIRRPDPLRGGATADFAACGAVAGVMARTDATRGVWKAPAGIDAGLVGVTGLTVPLTDAENGTLNPRGLNCLRTFRDVGSVVWGARTLRGADLLADEYRYVPVRRLALFLEESLYRGTQWVVFEPNDEPLWSQIRVSLGAFMQDLFRRGAFQGSTPRDAFFVLCDAETTTQTDIDRGIVNIVVGFAPLKPAEFVVIGIQQKTAAANG